MRLVGTLAALLLAAPPKQDARLLKLIERENQIASLLTAGKLAYDAGDYAMAAAKWDALLKVEGVPPDVTAEVKPLLAQARGLTGLQGETKQPPQTAPPPPPANVTVSGTVSGGGSVGPGGAVITLRRVDGWTGRPAPLSRPLLQKDKRFLPHVMAVPVGSSINFKNEDEIFHNVFSLSPVARFD